MLAPLLFALQGFLLGGVMFSYHIPKLFRGVDIVKLSPDGNPGMTNVMKLCGIKMGAVCLLCDLLKGFVPVFVALKVVSLDSPWIIPVLIAPVLGHAAAAFYPFGGGKAIATSIGVLLALIPHTWIVFALLNPYVFYALVVVVRPDELRTVCCFFLLMLVSWVCTIWTKQFNLAFGTSGIALIAMWKNRTRFAVNLGRKSGQ